MRGLRNYQGEIEREEMAYFSMPGWDYEKKADIDIAPYAHSLDFSDRDQALDGFTRDLLAIETDYTSF